MVLALQSIIFIRHQLFLLLLGKNKVIWGPRGTEKETSEITVGYLMLLLVDVRTAQIDTILNEPPVIIIQMRVNTCLPESVPRVIPHLETRITDTSFIQNNIKSGSPGMCSNMHPGSAYAYTVYNRIHRQ